MNLAYLAVFAVLSEIDARRMLISSPRVGSVLLIYTFRHAYHRVHVQLQ